MKMGHVERTSCAEEIRDRVRWDDPPRSRRVWVSRSARLLGLLEAQWVSRSSRVTNKHPRIARRARRSKLLPRFDGKAVALACIARKSSEICERCRLLEFGHLGGVFQAAALRVALAIGEE